MNTYLRRGAAFAAALALTAAIPAAAHAATLTNAGGTLTYTGTDADSQVGFSQADPAVDTVTVNDFSGDDPITATGCTGTGPYDCAGVTLVVADAAGGSDQFYTGGTGTVMQVPARMSGGAGDDTLYGGDGADALSGGPGDDVLDGGRGTDTLSGGTGIDSANFSTSGGPVSVSLDGIANDGFAGENDAVGADIEDVTAYRGTDPNTLTGSAGANNLTGGDGPDSIDGGGGNDTLSSYGGDDLINARDGYADRVYCGSGTDGVAADTLDVVSESCENVTTADVGNANEDKPPTVAWATPASGAKFAGSKLTTLAVDATDDKAVTKVVFMDDERVVCTDTAAPYTCAYQARGADLGRNTLTAISYDALGQTASSTRGVVVSRFSAKSVSLKVSRKGSRYTASGKVSLPSTVTRTQGCKGTTVKVTAKRGSRTVSTRTAKVNSKCAYSVRITSARRGLKFKASFSGSDTVSARSSRAVSSR